MENIEAIGASVHLGKKSSMSIPDAQYPMLDLHAQAILIQLYRVDDGVSQRGNVVDTGEQPVLASLSGEEDRAQTMESSSEKNSHHPVMWWVAPMPRY
jgi:hypothetical protein